MSNFWLHVSFQQINLIQGLQQAAIQASFDAYRNNNLICASQKKKWIIWKYRNDIFFHLPVGLFILIQKLSTHKSTFNQH